MSRLSRDLLAKAFTDPRMIGEFEELDAFLTDAETRVTALLESAEQASARLTEIEGVAKQPLSDLLTAIAGLPDDAGVVEFVGDGQAQIRGVDATDDASLVSRGRAISFAGKGPTGSRPALSDMNRAIYFDTSLAGAGMPIFWTGSAWVKHDGTAA